MGRKDRPGCRVDRLENKGYCDVDESGMVSYN